MDANFFLVTLKANYVVNFDEMSALTIFASLGGLKIVYLFIMKISDDLNGIKKYRLN